MYTDFMINLERGVTSMLQDIGPGRYRNQFLQPEPATDDFILLYRGDSVLTCRDADKIRIPRRGQLPEALGALCCRYAFSVDEDRFFYGYLLPEQQIREPGEGLVFLPSREYRNMQPMEAAFACSVGESLHRWHRSNRFCGRCGSPMEDSTTERARVCPKCGLTVYPKICPAVIVAVCDGDRLLLTKYQGRAFKRYALVAGFNEIGETIEETVHREVLEETGLQVKNLRFYKSQPWVLTDSLLMGFYCQLDGVDRITLQEDELSEARWFSRAELPTDHSGISLTGEMIERLRTGEETGFALE